MLQFVSVWLPVILAALAVSFYRNCVIDPKLPRITWWLVPLFAIPILGLIGIAVIIGISLAILPDAKLNKESRFVKKWFLN